MKIGIVKGQDPALYTVNDRLSDLLAARHHVTEYSSLSHLAPAKIPEAHLLRFSRGSVGTSPSNAEMIEVAVYLEQMGSRPVNSIRSFLISSNKHLTHLCLASSGVPQPSWAIVSGGETVFFGAKWKELTIKKPLLGGGGAGITIHSSLVEARKTDCSGHILQPYIENSAIWRVVVCENGVITAYQKEGLAAKESTAEIISIGLGAKRKYLDAPKELKTVSENMLRSLNLRISGMDVLETPDGFLALESNANFDFPEEERGVFDFFTEALERAGSAS